MPSPLGNAAAATATGAALMTAVIGSASYVVAMSGQFTVTGFASTVTVDKTDAAHPSGCRYVVAWTATRSSGQNVIPG